jgi:signal peptidase
VNDSSLALVALLAAAIAATTYFGVTVGTVTSDSMNPALTTGDAFVLVDGEPEVGDIATFRQPTDGGSRLVTHRVVGTTTSGAYVTRGDANPSTDQAAGGAPVTREAIVGVVPSVGGSTLVIPAAGGLARLSSDVRVPLLGLVLLALGYDVIASGRPSPTRVPHVTYGQALAVIFLMGTIGGVVGVVAVGASNEVVYTATAADTAQGPLVPVERTVEREVTLEAVRPAYSYRFVDATGAAVAGASTDGTVTTVTLRVGPLQSTGPHAVRLQIDNVPTTLPRPVAAALYDLHPMAAIAASVSAVTVPIYLLSRFLLPVEVPISWIINARSDAR